jgi:uncharacterized protein (TIGR03435 family)
MNRIALIPLLAPVLFAQPFEVASVRVSPPRSGEAQYVKMNIDAARASYINVTLRLLISIAFEIGDNRITGGEAWMDSTKYDVDAKLPPGAGKQQIPQMLQTLLTERFGLAVHNASKTMPAYDLVVAKNGPKLKSAAPDGSGSNYILKGKIVGPQLSMGALADILSRQTARPVKDTTGIAGIFDIRLNWTPDDVTGKDTTGDDPSIYVALQEQLGLQLKAAKEDIDFLVIDHANRTPSES